MVFHYLANRIQAVVDEGGTVSQWLQAATGVPQESILVPLLFAIFINDLPRVLSFANHLIYADDTQIYVHCLPRDIIDCIRRAQSDAQAVALWALQNGLKLNLFKTKIIILGSELYIAQLNISSLPKIIINGTTIPYSNTVKSLGVTISSTLQWKYHTVDVIWKVHRLLHSLRFH